MIVPNLHQRAVGLDPAKHRELVLPVPLTDWTPAAGLSALFLTAAECVHAARDFPIVFVNVGKDEQGADDYAPVALLGVKSGENLYVDADGRWRASHLPAVLSSYPLCVARVDAERFAVCIDEAWTGGASATGGRRLFDDAGQPTELLRTAQSELQRIEQQIDQTRAVGRHLASLGILQERRLDGTLPDGSKVNLDGFMMIDEEKVKALPDDIVLELHRGGLLALIHAHWISLGHTRRLLEWRAARAGIAAPPVHSA